VDRTHTWNIRGAIDTKLSPEKMSCEQSRPSSTLEEPAAARAIDSIKQACFAIIWLKNDGQSFDGRVVMDELGRHDGVISARFSRRDPMMMMVEYDSNRTRRVRDISSTG